jgi:hypothetical protein
MSKRMKRSKYAQKKRQKIGGGRINPNWMWWAERGTPAEEAITADGARRRAAERRAQAVSA